MNTLSLFKSEIDYSEYYTVIDGIDASKETLVDYKARIKKFADRTKGNVYESDVFLNYKRSLESDDKLKVSSKNKYLSAAKSYLTQLHKKGVLKVDPTVNVKMFKVNKGHKVTGHTTAQVEVIMNSIKLCALNDQAMIYLLAFQGLRQVELERLNIEHLDLINGTAMIKGKGRDDYEIIKLLGPVKEKLKEYVEREGRKSGKLFSIGARQMRNRYHKIASALGITNNLHGLRHYFVTTVLEARDGNTVETMKYTRHKSLEMLKVYNDNLETKKSLPVVEAAFGKVMK